MRSMFFFLTRNCSQWKSSHCQVQVSSTEHVIYLWLDSSLVVATPMMWCPNTKGKFWAALHCFPTQLVHRIQRHDLSCVGWCNLSPCCPVVPWCMSLSTYWVPHTHNSITTEVQQLPLGVLSTHQMYSHCFLKQQVSQTVHTGCRASPIGAWPYWASVSGSFPCITAVTALTGPLIVVNYKHKSCRAVPACSTTFS